MLLRLRNAANSMTEQIRHQETTANNLANANTVGYKRQRLFTAAIEEYLDNEEAPQSTRQIQQGADWRLGAVEQTGNPLDVAIDGEGFLAIEGAGGDEQYTRAGRLQVSADGTLQTATGQPVLGDGGPIQFPTNYREVSFGTDGTVEVDGQVVGQVRIVRFEDPNALQRAEGTGFLADGAEPLPAEESRLLQGHVERSNVDPVHEMTEMIAHFRQYESQQKVLSTTDQILGRITRQLGSM